MKLSYVIIICDKDYKNLHNLVRQAQATAKYDYEIIVMDNREEYKNIKILYDDVKVYSMGGNDFQFNAKRIAVTELCTGDYIWFIDGDDSITACPTIDETADIIAFNYTSDDGFVPNYIISAKEEYTENFNHIDFYKKIGVPMWAKLLRKDIIYDFYKKAGPHKIHLGEDALLLVEALYNAKKVVRITDSCYKYSKANNDADGLEYTDINKLKRVFTGCKDPCEILDSTIPKEVQVKTGLSSEFFKNSAASLFGSYYQKCYSPALKNQFLQEVGLTTFTQAELEAAGFQFQ